jgi:DNA-binding ferritin-like protein
VDRLVLDLANPLDREASDLLELIESLSTTYDRTTRDAATHEEKVRHTLEAYSNLREITEREKSVRKTAKDKSYTSDMLTELHNEIKKVAAKLKSGFGMPDVELDED